MSPPSLTRDALGGRAGMSRASYGAGPHRARAAAGLGCPSTLPEREGQEGKNAGGIFSQPGHDYLASVSLTCEAAARRPGANLAPADRPHGRSLLGPPRPTIHPASVSPTGRPARSPGARPALTSSISRSRILGGCGVPLATSPAALSISSSCHFITTATAAMATKPGAPEPGRAAGRGRVAFPSRRRD